MEHFRDHFSWRQQRLYGFWAAVGFTILIAFALASAYVQHAPTVNANRTEMTTVGERATSDPIAPATIAVPNHRE